MIDTKLIQDYLMLRDQIDKQEELVSTLKEQKKDMERGIHSMLAAEGAGKINVFGYTISPRRTMRARYRESMEGLIGALRKSGLSSLVSETVSAMTLSGWVREFDPDRMLSAEELREKLPAGVADWVELYEDFGLSVKRSE